MKCVTISDIHKRLRGLQYSGNVAASNNRIFEESARSILASGRTADIKRFIETAAKSNNIQFYPIIELFECLIDKGTVSDIHKYGSIISEGVVNKLRDAKQTQSLIKRRMNKLKKKLNPSTSTDNKHAPSNNKTKPTNNGNAPSTPDNKSNDKTKAAISEYTKMLETVDMYINCDRVLENYNKISKRFNLELLFVENTRVNGVRDTVVELCNRIDTYSMPTYVKFNTVIESAWYGFESNFIDYKKSDILESALDYFLFKEDGVSSCKDILDSTIFYDKDDDMKNIDIITEEEPEPDTISTKNEISSDIMNHYASSSKPVRINENSDFNKIFNNFKKTELSKNKDENLVSKLKDLIHKLYRKDVNSIVENTPDLLSWIRRFFIIGTGAAPIIGPVIMIIGLIADKFISLHMYRDEVEKMTKCFVKEIELSKKKLDSTTDYEDKERLKKYIESLEKAKNKIDEYYSDLLYSDEMDERYSDEDSSSDSSYNFGDDDFGFDLDDNDDEFLEFAAINNMAKSVEDIVNTINESPITDLDMYSIVSSLNDEDITNVSIIASKYPEVFYKEAFVDGINNTIRDIRKNKITFESALSRSLRLNSLYNALSVAKSTPPVNTSNMSIYETYNYIYCIKEAYKAIHMICTTPKEASPLIEASILNTLRMASMKLRNAIQKMSDKEKSISKSIDVGLNNLTKSTERALTNDNRESIIKGSILPSASKIIKLAIVNAGLIAIGQPILAVIATLGYLGASAKFKAKERQMLIDEIEIELKMCQKYIDIAEQKNDMKALKQLLMIQRDLERQQQRIKYKMKAEFGQKYYDAKNVGDN